MNGSPKPLRKMLENSSARSASKRLSGSFFVVPHLVAFGIHVDVETRPRITLLLDAFKSCGRAPQPPWRKG